MTSIVPDAPTLASTVGTPTKSTNPIIEKISKDLEKHEITYDQIDTICRLFSMTLACCYGHPYEFMNYTQRKRQSIIPTFYYRNMNKLPKFHVFFEDKECRIYLKAGKKTANENSHFVSQAYLITFVKNIGEWGCKWAENRSGFVQRKIIPADDSKLKSDDTKELFAEHRVTEDEFKKLACDGVKSFLNGQSYRGKSGKRKIVIYYDLKTI